mgnify:CR=1 FL=1
MARGEGWHSGPAARCFSWVPRCVCRKLAGTRRAGCRRGAGGGAAAVCPCHHRRLPEGVGARMVELGGHANRHGVGHANRRAVCACTVTCTPYACSQLGPCARSQALPKDLLPVGVSLVVEYELPPSKVRSGRSSCPCVRASPHRVACCAHPFRAVVSPAGAVQSANANAVRGRERPESTALCGECRHAYTPSFPSPPLPLCRALSVGLKRHLGLNAPATALLCYCNSRPANVRHRTCCGLAQVVDMVEAGAVGAFRALEGFAASPVLEMPVRVEDMFTARS